MYISLSPQFSAAQKTTPKTSPKSQAAKAALGKDTKKASPLQVAAELGKKAAALLKQEQRASEKLRQAIIQTYGLAPDTTLEAATIRDRRQWKNSRTLNHRVKADVQAKLSLTGENVGWEQILKATYQAASQGSEVVKSLPKELVERSQVYAVANHLGILGPAINTPLENVPQANSHTYSALPFSKEELRLRAIAKIDGHAKALGLRTKPFARHHSVEDCQQEKTV